jgi:hypothetical protein
LEKSTRFFFLKKIKLKKLFFQGYYCRGEILFETKHFTPALLSSLQGLTLDPEDKTGKEIMARVSG